MKVALQDGILRVREVSDFQYKILRDSGRLKWDKTLKELRGQASLEVLDILAGMVTGLPNQIEAYRQLLRKEQEAVDKLRLQENPAPLVTPQLKEGITPFSHQITGMNIAMILFGLADPDKVIKEDAHE